MGKDWHKSTGQMVSEDSLTSEGHVRGGVGDPVRSALRVRHFANNLTHLNHSKISAVGRRGLYRHSISGR
jgi:hypothetical protein